MNIFKRFKNKILSIVLSFTITIVPIASATTVPVFAADSLSKTRISKKLVKESFSERHPIFVKILKLAGVAIGAWATVTATYYGGRFVLDKINPERVTQRQELANIRTKKCEFALGRNTNMSAERLRNLNDRESILTNSGNISGTFINTATGLAGIGGALTVLNYGAKAIDNLGKFAKRIEHISWLRYAGSNFIEIHKFISDRLKSPPKNLSKENALENLDIIFEDFHGQKEASSVLKSHLYDIVVAKDQAKWKNEKYNRCDILYLYGPSGVGKSFISKRLPLILMQGSDPLIMSSSDVDKEKKDSVVDQLFRTEKQESEQSGKIAPTKPLIKYLKNNPGGVVIFEEYDKVCTPALDEVFRTAMELGTINIDGEKYDISGTTFIFTSNEDDISMEGFEKTDQEKLDKQSLSEGYTRVWHSKSFLNRVKKVKFNNLTAIEYAEIIKNHFDAVAAYWADENNENIKLTINTEIIQTLANEVEKINQGARPIDLWILPEIQMSLGEKIKSAPDYDFYRGKSFDVVYDDHNKKFEICET